MKNSRSLKRRVRREIMQDRQESATHNIPLRRVRRNARKDQRLYDWLRGEGKRINEIFQSSRDFKLKYYAIRVEREWWAAMDAYEGDFM